MRIECLSRERMTLAIDYHHKPIDQVGNCTAKVFP